MSKNLPERKRYVTKKFNYFYGKLTDEQGNKEKLILNYVECGEGICWVTYYIHDDGRREVMRQLVELNK